MEERKSMGSALVDVFDAGVVLVKSEINAVVKKGTELAKAKGIGVVLMLAAVGPLVMGLIFIILAIFYGLMRLGLGAWAAALVIALVSFAITGALIFIGLKKLSAEVDTGLPKRPVDMNSPEFKGSSQSAPKGVPASSLTYKVPDVAAASAVQGTTFYSADHNQSSGSHSAASQGAASQGASGHTAAPHSAAAGRHTSHDSNLQNPVTLKDAPGIAVSTTPTFREDMKREGLDIGPAPKGGH